MDFIITFITAQSLTERWIANDTGLIYALNAAYDTKNEVGDHTIKFLIYEKLSEREI